MLVQVPVSHIRPPPHKCYTLSLHDALPISGVVEMPPERVEYKGRLRPGRMLLVDTAQGRIIADDEIKRSLASRHPYRQWQDRKSTRLNSSHANISYAVFCLKKKNQNNTHMY